MESSTQVIIACVNSTSVLALRSAFNVYKRIWDTFKRLAGHPIMKEQLITLLAALAHLLQILDREYRNGRLTRANTTQEKISSLQILLDDIFAFVKSQARTEFLTALFQRDENIKAFQQFHRRIASAARIFNILPVFDIQPWQERDAAAYSKDQHHLHAYLSSLECNQDQLVTVLDMQHNSKMAITIFLQKGLDKNLITNKHEVHFIKHCLHYLVSTSHEKYHIDSWTVTSFEVEFGELIGSGGFGQVYQGFWNKTPVALKVLKTQDGVRPSSVMIRKEIMMWLNLRHPNVLQFLGANILDDTPFIMMPLLRNGNARNYVQSHPSCNRIKILHDISLGLVHLHSQHVIHGDLKAVNVLIDDGHNALLCDFGLSRLKADISISSANNASPVAGSRNWMSPERLLGGNLRKPVDIYAFGMTLYEIITTEVPLGHIPPMDFIDLVVTREVRPERPEKETCPDLPDDLWEIAEHCWGNHPGKRPDAVTLCNEMEQCLVSHRKKKGTSVPFPPEVVEQPSTPSTQEVLDSKLSPLHLPKQNFTQGSSRHSIAVVRRGDEGFSDEKGPSRRYSTLAIKPESSSKLPSQEEHLGPRKEAKVPILPPKQHHKSLVQRLSLSFRSKILGKFSRSSTPRFQNTSLPSIAPFHPLDVDWITLSSSEPVVTNQSPPTISCQDPSKPPLPLEQLSKMAEDDILPEEEPIGHYLATAEAYHSNGNVLRANGDLEGAYVYFTKAANLISDKIPLHWEYYERLTPTQRQNVASHGRNIRDQLDKLTPSLVERYNKWKYHIA